MRLRFNQLPEKAIIEFLSHISAEEKLGLSNQTLQSIQQLYRSDIRSMINYMQSNQNLIGEQKVIGRDIWGTLTTLLEDPTSTSAAREYIDEISCTYNIEIKNLVKDYLNYIIRYRSDYVTRDFLKFAEFVMHMHDPKVEHVKNYSVIRLHGLFSS